MKQTLKYIYENLLNLQKFAESKHSISITLASAVIVFSVTFIYQNIMVVSILSIASILFCLLAILYGCIALMAKNTSEKIFHRTIKDENLMNYKNISAFDSQKYLDAIKKSYDFPKVYKPDNFDKDLAMQIIATAKMIDRKFTLFNFSVLFIFAGITCLLIAICVIGGLVAY